MSEKNNVMGSWETGGQILRPDSNSLTPNYYCVFKVSQYNKVS